MFIRQHQRLSFAFSVDCGLIVFRYYEIFSQDYGNFSFKRRTMKSAVMSLLDQPI